MLEQECARLVAEGLNVQFRAGNEGGGTAHGVNPGDEAADPLQRFRIVEVGRAAAASRIESELKAGVHARIGRRDHRDLAPGELAREGMLLVDLSGAPAPWPVELEHARRAILQPDLVDPVLVAVQRQEAAVGAKAGRIAGVEHDLRG